MKDLEFLIGSARHEEHSNSHYNMILQIPLYQDFLKKIKIQIEKEVPCFIVFSSNESFVHFFFEEEFFGNFLYFPQIKKNQEKIFLVKSYQLEQINFQENVSYAFFPSLSSLLWHKEFLREFSKINQGCFKEILQMMLQEFFFLSSFHVFSRPIFPYKEFLRELEELFFAQGMELTNFNKSHLSNLLGIKRTTLIEKMKEQESV